MTRTLVLLLALCPGVVVAQQPFVGAWQLSYPIGARIEDGIETPIIGTGLFTVEAKGDSLIGMLATDPMPDMPARPPLRLAGKAGAGEARFLAHSKATININGAEREATVVSTWVLRAKGDSIGGTVERSIEGMEAGMQGAKPVSGTRRKS